MLQELAPFGFLGLFQVVGGLVAGDGLRKVFVDHMLRGAFLVIWGMFFGGIPALLGFATSAGSRQPLLALVGPLLFVGALLFAMLLGPWLAREVGSGTLLTLAAGLVFMLLGGSIAAAIVHAGKGSTWVGLIIAGFFVLMGLWLCWMAISSLLQGKSLGEVDATASHGA